MNVKICTLCARGHLREVFSAELDPYNLDTLAQAEARVEREWGDGVEVACRCGSRIVVVTLRDGVEVERLTADEFVKKYDALGSDKRNYG